MNPRSWSFQLQDLVQKWYFYSGFRISIKFPFWGYRVGLELRSCWRVGYNWSYPLYKISMLDLRRSLNFEPIRKNTHSVHRMFTKIQTYKYILTIHKSTNINSYRICYICLWFLQNKKVVLVYVNTQQSSHIQG